MCPCAPDPPAWNPQSVSRKARKASSGGTVFKAFLGFLVEQGPGHGLPPTDTAAFLVALLRPTPGEGDLRPGLVWRGAVPSLGGIPLWKPQKCLAQCHQPLCTKLHWGSLSLVSCTPQSCSLSGASGMEPLKGAWAPLLC